MEEALRPAPFVLRRILQRSWTDKTGAEDGIRTRDPLLGKEVLYH